MPLIRITGGLPGEPVQATAGGMTIDRRPGEALREFEARAEATAAALGADTVVIGGLPDDLPDAFALRGRLLEALAGPVAAYAEAAGVPPHVAAGVASAMLFQYADQLSVRRAQ
ncbi:MAG TPA: hypothetical protein VND19_18700 [Acetobacteraceae bacterium]|nr:hypothetical protein [Acetobacteraceae bacterium]